MKYHEFAACAEKVYSGPLSCGNHYVDQTGPYLNERLREHHYVSKTFSGHLGQHCRNCDGKYQLLLDQSVVTGKHNQIVGEILEATEIKNSGNQCVSTPSIALSDNEHRFLAQTTPPCQSLVSIQLLRTLKGIVRTIDCTSWPESIVHSTSQVQHSGSYIVVKSAQLTVKGALKGRFCLLSRQVQPQGPGLFTLPFTAS